MKYQLVEEYEIPNNSVDILKWIDKYIMDFSNYNRLPDQFYQIFNIEDIRDLSNAKLITYGYNDIYSSYVKITEKGYRFLAENG